MPLLEHCMNVRARRAQVVLVCGPSGAGKSRFADATGLPVVRLDDFYRSGNDPALPRSSDGAVDWDDPRSWDADGALDALEALCRDGGADLPVYDIASDGVVGTRRVVLGEARVLVAEGIFAAEIIGACRDRGLLALALSLRSKPYVTFWRRLFRDVRERRKPVRILVRRGVRLMRIEKEVVARHQSCGALVVSSEAGVAMVDAAIVEATG
jgi:uridine kinase